MMDKIINQSGPHPSLVDQVKVLSAYWEGVSNVLPEAFKNPPRYALQKATGVQVMHKLLIVVIENLRSEDKSVLEPESYEFLLRDPLLHLEGDTANGDSVRGADFWKVGSLGAAGSFSNNAGRRVLTARLKGTLPRVKAR